MSEVKEHHVDINAPSSPPAQGCLSFLLFLLCCASFQYVRYGTTKRWSVERRRRRESFFSPNHCGPFYPTQVMVVEAIFFFLSLAFFRMSRFRIPKIFSREISNWASFVLGSRCLGSCGEERIRRANKERPRGRGRTHKEVCSSMWLVVPNPLALES